MSIADEIRDESLESLRADVLKVRRERDSAIGETVRVSKQLEQVQRALSVVEQVESAQLQPVKWLMPSAKPRPSAATLVLMLSDLHLDEIVEPDEVDGLNASSTRHVPANKRIKAPIAGIQRFEPFSFLSEGS